MPGASWSVFFQFAHALPVSASTNAPLSTEISTLPTERSSEAVPSTTTLAVAAPFVE
nr:hypothetical protein [Cohnella faecalis]